MGGRLASRECFFAVKKNVDEIKREEFKEPKKEDEYSTSVLGIQFTRGNGCTVQIISRYNHTVGNPNCTLGNDLDRLATGLEQSFTNLLAERGLILNNSNKEEFLIPGYTIGNDGKYYKYNMEIDGDYYCPGNILIWNGEVKSVSSPEEGLLIDYFFLDKKNKKIKVICYKNDSFVNDLQDIKKIEVVKSKEDNIERIIKIYLNDIDIPVIIGIDRDNQIVKYENKNVTNIGDKFLYYNKGLTKLRLPSLKQSGNYFLNNNEALTQLELPGLAQVGDFFLCNNKCLTQLKLPSLTQVGEFFVYKNECLTQLELPCLTYAGYRFLSANEGLTHLELPCLTYAGDYFLYSNNILTNLELPSLIKVGHDFLFYNQCLTQLELASLTQVGADFLFANKKLSRLKLPSLTEAKSCFLCQNIDLTHLELPNLKQVGKGFLQRNEGLTHLELPCLTYAEGDFLYSNKILTHLELPSLTKAEDHFLFFNKCLTQLKLPNLKQVGNYFLPNNEGLVHLELPSLTQAGKDFLCNNKELTYLELPKLPKLRKSFSYRISKNKKKITSKSIAELDKDNELTTSEINLAHRIIEKIKDLFKKHHTR